jgi:transposase
LRPNPRFYLHLLIAIYWEVLVQGLGGRRALSRRVLTDEQWERIEGYLPGRIGLPGRRGVDNRLAVLWMAGNAAHWRDLPEVFGKWTAVHARFRCWSHKIP